MTAGGQSILIDCDHVSVAYGQQEVLHDVYLQIPSGTLLPFVGPNGAGTTTLLRAILGLVGITHGRIQTPFGEKPAGYVPQQKTIDPLYPVTTRQIVEMGLFTELGWWGRPNAAQRRRVDENLDRFGLLSHQFKTFAELSGGMKQKALLGRALVSNAEVFIMDEPTSELDEESERDVMAHFASMVRDEGKSVLLAHHGLDQAASLSPTVCVVHRGYAQLASVNEARRLLVGTFSVEGFSHA